MILYIYIISLSLSLLSLSVSVSLNTIIPSHTITGREYVRNTDLCEGHRHLDLSPAIWIYLPSTVSARREFQCWQAWDGGVADMKST